MFPEELYVWYLSLLVMPLASISFSLLSFSHSISHISEFVVKVFANAKPQNYLEWGTGTSTSFYPLLAESKVYAIDG